MEVTEKYHQFIRRSIKVLQGFVNRIWFPPLLLLLAALDTLLIVIPTDGILISSSMLMKKRWISFGLFVAVGSAIGALTLISLVNHLGLDKILQFYPGVEQTKIWKMTFDFFHEYGLIVVFLIGVTPFTQQPALIIAALSDIPIAPLAAAILISRVIKFSVMAYIATHAPRLLSKLWGIQGELKDTGV